jgi:hypothetical protein
MNEKNMFVGGIASIDLIIGIRVGQITTAYLK